VHRVRRGASQARIDAVARGNQGGCGRGRGARAALPSQRGGVEPRATRGAAGALDPRRDADANSRRCRGSRSTT
jgi:hypothetical protein